MGLTNPNIGEVASDLILGTALISWEEPEMDNKSSGIMSSVKKMIFGAANEIDPDVIKSEAHQFQSEVTQNVMETGSIVAEHIIQKPIRVTLTFEMTNGTLGGRMNTSIQGLAGKLLGFELTFDKLVKLWEKKIECTISTFHKKYENMVIENMPIVHKAPYKGAYKVSCDFVKLNKKYLGIMSAKEKGTAQSAMETQEGGLQKTEPPSPDVKKATVGGEMVNIEPGKYYEASSAAEANAIVAAGGISW